MMIMARTKVYPNAAAPAAFSSDHHGLSKPLGSNSVALTVWKKSLIPSCDGFTVFNSKGNLVFRVDNYMAGGKGEIFLMDASGKTLLTIRRKRLSLTENWLVYDGEETVNPRYSVRKVVGMLNPRCLAQVTAGNGQKRAVYAIEGSYSRRCCAVYDDKRRCVAEIKRKEGVGGVVMGTDVFRLVVNEPGIDSAAAMALVIILDHMFGSLFHF